MWLHRAFGQPEAALVVLTYAQQRRQDVAIKVSWLKKLGRWQDGLTSYEHAQLVRNFCVNGIFSKIYHCHMITV